MHDLNNPLVWFTALLALAIGVFLLRGRFTAEARARRRRDKSNRPIISRKQGPTVRLAVKVDKRGRARKR